MIWPRAWSVPSLGIANKGGCDSLAVIRPAIGGRKSISAELPSAVALPDAVEFLFNGLDLGTAVGNLTGADELAISLVELSGGRLRQIVGALPGRNLLDKLLGQVIRPCEGHPSRCHTHILPDSMRGAFNVFHVCHPCGDGVVEFCFVSWETEGTEVAKWLAAHGAMAFIPKCRLTPPGISNGPPPARG